MLDGLFGGNLNLLYFISLFLLFPRNKNDIRKAFLLAYLCSFLLSSFNIMKTLDIILIFIITTFMLNEYFLDDKQNLIIKNFIYKFMDYMYRIFFEYVFFYFLIVMFLTTTLVQEIVSNFNSNLVWVCFVISGIILLYISNYIVSIQYKTYSFTEVYNRLNSICNFTEYNEKYSIMESEAFVPLIVLEDSEFLTRSENFNILYKNYLFPRIKKHVCLFIKNKHKWNYIKRNFTFLLRGYSSIEMQIIRTIGLERGYKNTIKRKIYEFMYSVIYLKSLNNYYRYLEAPYNKFRYYLLYIYIKIAPAFFEGKMFRNMEALFDKEVKYLNKEEVFIGTLCFSNKFSILTINQVLEVYNNQIKNLGINKESLYRVYDKLLIEKGRG